MNTRTRKRASALATLAVAALTLAATGQDGPRATPPVVVSGIEFRLVSVNTTTAVTFSDPAAEAPGPAPRIESQIQVTGRLSLPGAPDADSGGPAPTSAGGKLHGPKKKPGSPPPDVVVFPWRLLITSVLDDRERELADPGRADRRDQEWTRATVANHFWQALAQPQGQQHLVQDWVRGLNARPERVDRIRGRAQAVIGGRVIRRPVDLKPMEDGLEIAPGVLLLITEVTIAERRSVVDFEVRTRRAREPGRAGCEPIFVGLSLRDENGDQVLLRNGQEIETRDEYLFLAREQMIPREFLSRVKSAEAIVVDEVRPVDFDFEVSGLSTPR